MHRSRQVGVLVLWSLPLLLGCGDAPRNVGSPIEDPSTPIGGHFDAATAGSIHGQVKWAGAIPTVAPYEIWPNPLAGSAFVVKQVQPNPNAPVINAASRGVGNAVVCLRGVDLERCKPWSQPPVRVEQRGRQIHVIQGEADSPFGFVRRGDRVEMLSRDDVFHSLHAGGAAFFTLSFPDPDQPCVRPMTENGQVDLTSAAGYYWMRGYLFVTDHPYFARTDAAGRFALEHVPPGRYEVVCWMPNWIKTRHEREPEMGVITRLFFGPPAQRIQTVVVQPGQGRQMAFVMTMADFGK